MTECNCGAATVGKYADQHSPTCPALSLRERLQNAVDLKADPRALENLCAEVLTQIKEWEAIGPFDTETLADLLRMLPNGLYNEGGVCTRNPVARVYFRAGLLACREYMARFVEQGGHPEIAQSIRANWWPISGADPGPPRLLGFDELCDEIEGPDDKVEWRTKEVSASIEALPRAYQFLLPSVQAGDPAEPKQD